MSNLDVYLSKYINANMHEFKGLWIKYEELDAKILIGQTYPGVKDAIKECCEMMDNAVPLVLIGNTDFRNTGRVGHFLVIADKGLIDISVGAVRAKDIDDVKVYRYWMRYSDVEDVFEKRGLFANAMDSREIVIKSSLKENFQTRRANKISRSLTCAYSKEQQEKAVQILRQFIMGMAGKC